MLPNKIHGLLGPTDSLQLNLILKLNARHQFDLSTTERLLKPSTVEHFLKYKSLYSHTADHEFCEYSSIVN